MDIDVDLFRSWIGRTAHASDVITPRLVEEFVATFHPHVPIDGGVCEAGSTDLTVPLGLHWCLHPAIAAAAALGEDGHPDKGGFLPPVPLPRRMWAGGEVEFIDALVVDDQVSRRSTIDNVAVKLGRSGPLCFVAVMHEYSTRRGLALRERQDIVYRDAAAPQPAGRPGPATPADRAWTMAASPVLLFRYSAMTFNGHRIHYDLPYATGVEGYAGLVVHGPLQATLLLNMACQMRGRPPRRFAYRGQAALMADSPFRVAGRIGGDDRLSCWTESAEGVVCMRADAHEA